jgi:hypothetical protein
MLVMEGIFFMTDDLQLHNKVLSFFDFMIW